MKILKILTIVLLLSVISPAYAWSNGGYSIGPSTPKYGTHDYILQKAINMLPLDMKNKIDLTAASYGTELPDCSSGAYCIGDLTRHHVYYKADKTLQDGIGATRAQAEYNLAKSYLQQGNKYQFSLHLGAMSAYLSDLAVFGHTMGAVSVWGAETHHSDYETYVENHISLFPTTFDGAFTTLSAYDGTLKLAKETTFDAGTYANVWMDDNYNWANPTYVTRTKNLINYDVNILADVTYTLIKSTSSTSSITVVSPNGGESWTRGTTKTISWSSTGSPGSYVKIELYKAGVFNRLIISSTPNDGSYYWYVPTTQAIAVDYKIKVTSTTNSAYTDQSNNNFIISAGSITVISPNGGESWQKGTTKTITWSKTGSTGSYVKIELLKAGVLNRVISSSTANDGSYSWTIPSTQTYGTDYKVRITSTTNSIYKDVSNNNFKIY